MVKEGLKALDVSGFKALSGRAKSLRGLGVRV